MLSLDCKDTSPFICYFILNIDRYDELLWRCMDDFINSYRLSLDINLTYHSSVMVERLHGLLYVLIIKTLFKWNVVVLY